LRFQTHKETKKRVHTMATTNNAPTEGDDDDDAFQAELERGRELNIQTLLNTKEPPTYKSEWARYKLWLTDHGRFPDSGGRWLSRPNLTYYFTTCLGQERTGERGTLRRCGNALTWYAKYREYPMENFNVKDDLFNSCLNAAVQRQLQPTNPSIATDEQQPK
jgi:hypothetical protein